VSHPFQVTEHHRRPQSLGEPAQLFVDDAVNLEAIQIPATGHIGEFSSRRLARPEPAAFGTGASGHAVRDRVEPRA
jgi:hypothetical protein